MGSDAVRQLRQEPPRDVGARPPDEDPSAAPARAFSDKWRQLACSLIESGQNERCRLAERLHGELQQLLTVALMRTWAAKRMTEDEKLRGVLAEVEDVVRHAVDETRSLTLDLSPPILRHGNLAKAAEWLTERLLEIHGLSLNISVPRSLPPISDALKAFVFNVTADCLLNRVASSGIKTARATIRCSAGELSLVISDKGGEHGAAPTHRNGRAAMPLIAEKVAAIGGTMRLVATDRTFKAEIVLPTKAFAECQPGRSRAIPFPDNNTPLEPVDAPPGVVRVLIAEDHRMVREGLVRLINLEADLCVIAEASNGEQAVELAARVKPDVVVIDVNMPVRGGTEAARMIRQQSDAIKIIGLSEYGDSVTKRAMCEAGAQACLCKDEAAEELCRAIRAVVPGPRNTVRRSKPLSSTIRAVRPPGIGEANQP